MKETPAPVLAELVGGTMAFVNEYAFAPFLNLRVAVTLETGASYTGTYTRSTGGCVRLDNDVVAVRSDGSTSTMRSKWLKTNVAGLGIVRVELA